MFALNHSPEHAELLSRTPSQDMVIANNAYTAHGYRVRIDSRHGLRLSSRATSVRRAQNSQGAVGSAQSLVVEILTRALERVAGT